MSECQGCYSKTPGLQGLWVSILSDLPGSPRVSQGSDSKDSDSGTPGTPRVSGLRLSGVSGLPGYPGGFRTPKDSGLKGLTPPRADSY